MSRKVFFFKQNTAYEMRISDWSSDVCSSDLLQSAPHRADPPCPFFGPCGGCALQHLEASAYAAWKEEQLAVALQRRGLVADTLHPLRRVAPGRRRRITWSAKRTAREIGRAHV